MRIPLQPLDRFVRDVLSSIGDEEAKGYVRMLRIAISVAKELNMFVIPNIRTVKLEVLQNLVVQMPDDTIEPILVGKDVGNGYLIALGKSTQLRRGEENPQCVDVDDVIEIVNPDDSITAYYHTGLGERYGRHDTRFYGKYNYDSQYNRLLIESEGRSVAVGDRLTITYKSVNDDFKVIPEDAIPMIRYKCLQMFFEAADPGKAMYMFNQFKVSLNEFRRNRIDRFNYEELLDSITSNWNSAPR